MSRYMLCMLIVDTVQHGSASVNIHENVLNMLLHVLCYL